MAGLRVTGDELIFPLSDRGAKFIAVCTFQLEEPA